MLLFIALPAFAEDGDTLSDVKHANSNLEASWETILPSTIQVSDGVTGGTITFDMSTGTITGCDDSVTKVIIPVGIRGVPVREIGEYAFNNKDHLESIVIPGSCEKIGDGAFQSCGNLQEVDVPGSVKSIGEFAFAYTKAVIYVNDGVEKIGRRAFDSCEGSVYLPPSVKELGVDSIFMYSSADLYCVKDSYIDKNATPPYGHKYYVNDDVFDDSIDLISLVQQSYSSIYDPELAYKLMQAAEHAYDSKADVENYLIETIGIDDDKEEAFNYYEDPSNPEYKNDSIAYSIGYKDTKEGRVVTIFLRGSYGKIINMDPDWRSDFRLDDTLLGVPGWHPGFTIASKEVFDQIESMGLLKEDGVKYVITGHSRGGGVGNLLAVRLLLEGVPKENVYDYNFACPDTSRGFATDWKEDSTFSNIFNIAHCADPVAQLPGVAGNSILATEKATTLAGLSWGKYGKSVFFTENWKSIPPFDFSYHDPKKYTDFMSGQRPFGYYKTWEQIQLTCMDNFMHGLLSIFSCPVDVIAKDQNGNLLASVINGELSYYEANNGSLLVITYGDSKWFIALNGIKVCYEVKATDSGTMNYEAYSVDFASGEETVLNDCSDISLEKGKQFVTDESALYVVDENKSIVAEVQKDGEEISVNGNSGDDSSCNHIWNQDYTIDKEASYTETGSKSIHCSVCNVAKEGSAVIIPKLKKKSNPMNVKTTKKTVKLKMVKKKAVTVAPITVKKAKGKVTYKITQANAKSKKALKLNAKTGKVTVKKKTKKGTYKMKVSVTAAGKNTGSPQYKAATKTVQVIIKVK